MDVSDHYYYHYYLFIVGLAGNKTSRGQESSLSDDLTKHFFGTALETIQHPYLLPVEKSEFIKEKSTALVVRPYLAKGSLKDHIYDKQPRGYYGAKYLTKKHGYPFKEPAVRLHGRQILEAVKFLLGMGLPVTHLHTGNIFVDEQVCQLADFENAVLGLSSLYHFQLLQFGKCQTPEEVAAFLFGLVLYEMAVGREYLPTPTSTPAFPSTTPKDLQKIIESILAPTTAKVPTIMELLEHPYFATVKLPEVPAGTFKKTAKFVEIVEVSKKDWASLMEHAKKHSSSPPSSPRLGHAQPPGAIARKVAKKSTSSTQVASKRTSQLLSPTGDGPSTSVAASSSSSSSQVPTLSNPPAGKSSSSGMTAKAPAKAPTATSSSAPPPHVSATSPPPPPPPPASAPPPPPPPTASSPPPPARSGGGRGNLLSSIESFSGGLKKVKTKDKSGPKLK